MKVKEINTDKVKIIKGLDDDGTEMVFDLIGKTGEIETINPDEGFYSIKIKFKRQESGDWTYEWCHPDELEKINLTMKEMLKTKVGK